MSKAMKLIDAHSDPSYITFLYRLLDERTPEQSISHKAMPSLSEHVNFVCSKPYEHWFIIVVNEIPVGSIYLTKQREIGVFILKASHGLGYGRDAVRILMKMYPGTFLWNTNPKNFASIHTVESLGGKLIQYTYELNS